jgi:hypothetical protein
MHVLSRDLRVGSVIGVGRQYTRTHRVVSSSVIPPADNRWIDERLCYITVGVFNYEKL